MFLRLLDGFQSTQLLYVAAELRLADWMADGPRSNRYLAEKANAQLEPIGRILRGLAAINIVAELPDGRFALTEVGAWLATDVPGSQRGAALARGKLYYAALGELLNAVRYGGPPFERLHGKSFFEHLKQHPAEAAAFRASMAARAAREADAVLTAYDFSRFQKVVDVGGGNGALLHAIRKAAPSVEVLLFDQPDVVKEVDLPSVGGDFFRSVPHGADAYVLSRVIHDWHDEDAVQILQTCREAMLGHSRLLIVEALLPARAADDPEAVRMDLHMLTLLHGRERTEVEYAALLARAGLMHIRTIATAA